MKIRRRFSPEADVTLYPGDCLDLLKTVPNSSARLVLTSPPYNIGKRYERKKERLRKYLLRQREVIARCTEVLVPGGSLCWQVGNHIPAANEIVPLDMALYSIFRRNGLRLRNRIIWHFEHGLHTPRRLSGRYEVILWFTKGDPDYVFNLDSIRVPQKYPGKRHWKGPNNGSYSGHPDGKNPSDVWSIPNVKHNHVEKTAHPCQFPIELAERLILALTNPGDLVVDPFIGVGSTAIAAIKQGRRAAGSDTSVEYLSIARDRLRQLEKGVLRMRPMNQPIYEPSPTSTLLVRDD